MTENSLLPARNQLGPDHDPALAAANLPALRTPNTVAIRPTPLAAAHPQRFGCGDITRIFVFATVTGTPLLGLLAGMTGAGS